MHHLGIHGVDGNVGAGRGAAADAAHTSTSNQVVRMEPRAVASSLAVLTSATRRAGSRGQ
jgi:hypothetical protein